MKEWDNRAYFRLNKISYGFKELARAHQAGKKCGLVVPKTLIVIYLAKDN